MKKFLNDLGLKQVFMGKGDNFVISEAILTGATRLEQTGQVQSQEQMVEALVREHARLIYRIAYAVLRRHQDAEDAVQETFIRVLRYSHRLEAIEDHKTWLARIAWRVAVERNRRILRKREISLDDPERSVAEPPSIDVSTDDAIVTKEVSGRLEMLIAALPEKLRGPLILSVVQEMNPRDIATVLGTSEAAVRSRIFRARQILREKLDETANRK